MNLPAIELTQALTAVLPGRALDLACGAGRHAIWLRNQGWQVTAVDLAAASIPGVTFITANLEQHQFSIEPQAWDLIVCWLYWQEDLLALIAAGIRPGGIAALAGKTTGRFATSLAQFRRAFPGWQEISAGEDPHKTFLIAKKPSPAGPTGRLPACAR
jgi:SAM-dependent methyltransferase